jgi:hypothetical protein
MRLREAMRHVWRWVFWRAVAADRRLNAILGGSAEETLSSRAYRMSAKGTAHWVLIACCINLLFWWQVDGEGRRSHCKQSHKHELARRGRVPGVDKEGNAECLWMPLDQ